MNFLKLLFLLKSNLKVQTYSMKQQNKKLSILMQSFQW